LVKAFNQPVRPPVAPVALILANASDLVVHAIEVPGLLTSGRAAQMVTGPHGVPTNLPPTH